MEGNYHEGRICRIYSFGKEIGESASLSPNPFRR